MGICSGESLCLLVDLVHAAIVFNYTGELWYIFALSKPPRFIISVCLGSKVVVEGIDQFGRPWAFVAVSSCLMRSIVLSRLYSMTRFSLKYFTCLLSELALFSPFHR